MPSNINMFPHVETRGRKNKFEFISKIKRGETFVVPEGYVFKNVASAAYSHSRRYGKTFVFNKEARTIKRTL